jgi:ABC-type multidrug transport system ATPase subunit
MIAGLLRADRGQVLIDGGEVRGDADPVKPKMGLVPQEMALHDELSPNDNLALFGALYGMRAARLKWAMDRRSTWRCWPTGRRTGWLRSDLLISPSNFRRSVKTE